MFDFNNEKTRSSYCEDSSEIHHNTRFLSNNSQPSYSHHMQFLPTQHFSTRPSLSPITSMSSPSKNSIDSSSFKNVSLPASTSRFNNLYLSLNTTSTTLSMPSTLSTVYQDIPESSYSQLSKHLFWNTNLFNTYSSTKTYSNTNDDMLSYSVAKLCDQTNSESKIDHSFSSNCSDVNSDDSIDVSENDAKNATKKRNPYSIEELLKKPEKKIRHTVQSPRNDPITNFTRSGTEVEGNINKISIEVCD